jgi:hypothetical protein
MQTLTWQSHPITLEQNKRLFPQLWANHKTEFHQFFYPDGTMNNNGLRAYNLLKERRKKRMQK